MSHPVCLDGWSLNSAKRVTTLWSWMGSFQQRNLSYPIEALLHQSISTPTREISRTGTQSKRSSLWPSWITNRERTRRCLLRPLSSRWLPPRKRYRRIPNPHQPHDSTERFGIPVIEHGAIDLHPERRIQVDRHVGIGYQHGTYRIDEWCLLKQWLESRR